jgi:hypothetical protein
MISKVILGLLRLEIVQQDVLVLLWRQQLLCLKQHVVKLQEVLE